MPRDNITPRNEERAFRLDELFFSTTDAKGVIQSGNDVFVRISGHPVERLIGQPHNIIRHPDMPRAVFKLLWDTISQKKPFAGYVKNMASDGSYYWVIALVVPIRDGYLSLRFKPTSPLLAVVKDLYADLLRIERAAGASGWREGMAKAMEALGGALKAKGFPNYEVFMQIALAEELAARRAALASAGDGEKAKAGKGFFIDDPEAVREFSAALKECQAADVLLDDLFNRVGALMEIIKKLESKSSFLLKLAHGIRLLSFNAQITSHRLTQGNHGLPVVAQNLSLRVDECSAIIKEMTEAMWNVTSSLRSLAFAATSAKLQVMMAVYFLKEVMGASTVVAAERDATGVGSTDVHNLISSLSVSVTQMMNGLPQVREPLRPLIKLHSRLTKTFWELTFVRVSGKVEAAYVDKAGHFQSLFQRLFDQLRVAEGELSELSSGVGALKEQFPKFERSGVLLEETIGRLHHARAAV
jgi:aerotaxis receptor